jgi:hypothetical protein
MKKSLPILGILSVVIPALGVLSMEVGVATHSESLGLGLIGLLFAPAAGFIFGMTALVTRERFPLVAVTGLLVSIAPVAVLFLRSKL